MNSTNNPIDSDNAEDPSLHRFNSQDLYGEDYYKHYCDSTGAVSYERSEIWLNLFNSIAERIVSDFAPQSVLDVGCAIGMLVEALLRRGVDAYGIDISEWAIRQMPSLYESHVRVGSILDASIIDRHFELVVCIEVLEHLQPQEADTAIANLCTWGDVVIFCSTPDDYQEVTHFNVQQPGYWAEKFAQHGFERVLDYDASNMIPWGQVYRRAKLIPTAVVRQYENLLWQRTKEIHTLRNLVIKLQSDSRDTRSNRDEMQHPEQESGTNTLAPQQNPADQQQIALLKAQIRDLQSQNSEARAFAQQQKNRADQLATAIARIQATRGWRTLTLWWTFKAKLIPSSPAYTRQRLLIRNARITIRQKGLLTFIDRTIRWLHGERGYWQELLTPADTSLVSALPYDNNRRAFLAYPVAEPQYERHIHATEPTSDDLEIQRMLSAYWNAPPVIAIVTPVYQPPLDVLKEMVQSVLNQTYSHWVWYLVDASPTGEIFEYLSSLSAKDTRIRPIRAQENKGISENTNIGLRQVTEDYIAILDHDDTLAPHALYAVADVIRLHPDVDLIYSDMDKLDEGGARCEPWFRPDWSPEFMISANYLYHLCTYKRALIEKVGYLDSDMDGAQDWDFYLRVGAVTSAIRHVPQVLYHWRKSPTSTAQQFSNKPYVRVRQQQAILNSLHRQNLLDPQVNYDDSHPIHWIHPLVTWKQRHVRPISIVIPSRDHLALIEPCLDSIFSLTTYPDFEVIVVDTGSTEAATEGLYRRFSAYSNFHVVRDQGEFNFSRACNLGAQAAHGELLLFLNNDTEVLQAEWLQWMAQWFEVQGIAVVGPKLLYSDNSVQHGGMVVGLGGLAGHLFANYPENSVTMFSSDGWYRNPLSVTGACLMVSRAAFNQVDQFDEGYELIFSDVDLCLKIRKAGYRTLYTPHVRLRHHEFGTRDGSFVRNDVLRASEKWLSVFASGDPYFNPNLSYADQFAKFSYGVYTAAYFHTALLQQLKLNIPALRLEAFSASQRGVNFVGDLRVDTGLGQSSRAMVDAALAAGVQIHYCEVENKVASRTTPIPELISTPTVYPITILHLNPAEIEERSRSLPKEALKDKHVIGVWYWELPRFPQQWLSAFQSVNEIWVASSYTRNTLAEVSPVPVLRMPLSVEVTTTGARRGDFGLPEDKFIFLFSFSPHSSVGRKNPFAVIEAFKRAFAGSKTPPLLVIKVHHLESSGLVLERALREAISAVDGLLLTQNYSRQEMYELINLCDAYVSLHRSEGFGLGMAEAMALGKPVIATAYSANMDFMTPKNSYLVRYQMRPIQLADHQYQPTYLDVYEQGQMWAEPDLDHAAELMQHVFNNTEQAREVGAQARIDMAEQHSKAALGKFIQERLTALRQPNI